MLDLSNPGTVKSILARHGFRFSKSLGQNFLIDPTVCPRMAQESGAGPGVGVLEIGPGLGVLTAELSKLADRVVCIELDRKLLPVLQETLAGRENVLVVNDDALKVDLNALIRREFPGMRVVVCANLPYYITSPVLLRFLEERLPVDALTVMVQKEAAQRLCARPGERACGAVSAAVWYFSEPEVLFPVPRTSFLPAPNVDSAVIRLHVRKTPPVAVLNEAELFRLVKAAFGQRRKTLCNAVPAGLGVSKERVAAALQSAGLEPNLRAEQLTLAQLARLCEKLFHADEKKEELQ